MTKEWSKNFIVANEKGLRAVGKYVKAMMANTYSYSGNDYIAIGYDASNGRRSGQYTKRGGIVVRREELFEPTCEEIEKALGWK